MRNFKKILALTLSVLFVLSLSLAFVSCGGDDTSCSHVDADSDNKCDSCGQSLGQDTPKETTHTVTVKDSNNQTVEGVELKITNRTDETEVLTTDANGKASGGLTVDGSAVKVEIVSVPDGYVLPTSKTVFPKGSTEATVTIAIDARVTHTVTVKDAGGNAVAGLSMMICQESCQTPVSTDENGVAVFKFVPKENSVKKIKIADASAPYEIVGELDGEGYLHFDTDTTEFEITVTAK